MRNALLNYPCLQVHSQVFNVTRFVYIDQRAWGQEPGYLGCILTTTPGHHTDVSVCIQCRVAKNNHFECTHSCREIRCINNVGHTIIIVRYGGSYYRKVNQFTLRIRSFFRVLSIKIIHYNIIASTSIIFTTLPST